MMTNEKIDIGAWLQSPRMVTEEEKVVLDQLIEQHPYYLSAQWMRMVNDLEGDDFSVPVLQKQKLYSGNWLLFYNTIQAAREYEMITPDQQTNDSIVASDRDRQETEEMDQENFDDFPVKAVSGVDHSEELIQPLYTENYFQYEGIKVDDSLPADGQYTTDDQSSGDTDPRSLMVMMGFDEWLQFLKKKSEAKKSEEEDKAFLRSMWQREKLAAAIGEEDDNIPEAVFEMAINSIDKEDLMVSESLADIHAKQGRVDKAIEMYKKLSLQNPEKKAYFAAKISQLNKENTNL